MLLRASLVALCLVVSPAVVSAAMLFEGEAGGEPLRMVADRRAERVLIELGGERSLVDLKAGHVYLGLDQKTPQRVRAYFRPGHDQVASYRLERFGPGPMVAGHASVYHVLFVGERVCAEILVSSWMAPFVDPAVRALALLDTLKQTEQAAAAAGSGGNADACAAIPVATLAAAGWPLLSGKIDRPTFETKAIRFDYRPAADELDLPEQASPMDAAEAAGSTR